jgi:hypothetical protein
MGLSPIAFARYFSCHAQENEHHVPFILYVDTHEEIARQTAEEISRLWQVPVVGLAFQNLRTAVSRGSAPRKILVNHIMCDNVRSMLSRNKSDVIPVEVRISEFSDNVLEQIKPNSSVVVIHRPQFSHSAQFILAGIRKLLEPQGNKISSYAVRDMAAFRRLVNKAEYDYYIAGPLVRGEVPPEMRQNPRIVQIQAQLDPASLEAARIRAGVVI